MEASMLELTNRIEEMCKSEGAELFVLLDPILDQVKLEDKDIDVEGIGKAISDKLIAIAQRAIEIAAASSITEEVSDAISTIS